MSAQKCKMHGGLLAALRKDAGIKSELDRLEKAANEQIRETFPRFRHEPGEVTDVFLEDLAAVASRDDWRRPLERSADRLRRAARHIREAVRLAVDAAKGCPTYATIPSIVWESLPEAEAEHQRIAASPAGKRLFAAMGFLIKRKSRTVIDPERIAPDFLKAMLVYAARCDNEATRIDSILKTRDARYDRLGPILGLVSDVQRLTGKPRDAIVARMLTDACEIAGSSKKFSPDSIRKLRERHLSS